MMQIAPLFPLAPASTTPQSHAATSQGGDSIFAGIFDTLRADTARNAPQPGARSQAEPPLSSRHSAEPRSDLPEIADTKGETPSPMQEDDAIGAGQTVEIFPYQLGFSSLPAPDHPEGDSRTADSTVSSLLTPAGAIVDQVVPFYMESVPSANSMVSPLLHVEDAFPMEAGAPVDTSVAEKTQSGLPSAASTSLSSEAFNGLPTPRAYPGVPQHAFFAFSDSTVSPLPGTSEGRAALQATSASTAIPASTPLEAVSLAENPSSHIAAPSPTDPQLGDDLQPAAHRPTVPGQQFPADKETTAADEAAMTRPLPAKEPPVAATGTLAVNATPGQRSPQAQPAGNDVQFDSTGQHTSSVPSARPEPPHTVSVTYAAAQPDKDNVQFRKTTVEPNPGPLVARTLTVAAQPADDGVDTPPIPADSNARRQQAPVIVDELVGAKEKSAGSLMASISRLTDLKPHESRQADRAFATSLRENAAASASDRLETESKGNADNQNNQNSFLGTKNQQGAGLSPTASPATFGNSPAESFGAVEQLNTAPGQTPQSTSPAPGGLPTSQQPSGPFFQHMDNGVLHQLTDRFQLQMRNQETRLKLQLQPAELGKLDISLTVKEGAVRAHVVAQSGQTQEILERNMHRLRAIFENQGFSIEDILISARSQVEADNDFFHGQQSRKGGGNGLSRQNYDTLPRDSFEEIISSAIETPIGVNITA